MKQVKKSQASNMILWAAMVIFQFEDLSTISASSLLKIQVNGHISGLCCTWLVPCTRASSDGADGFLTLRVDPLEEGRSTFRAWPNRYLLESQEGLETEFGPRIDLINSGRGTQISYSAAVDLVGELGVSQLMVGTPIDVSKIAEVKYLDCDIYVKNMTLFGDLIVLPFEVWWAAMVIFQFEVIRLFERILVHDLRPGDLLKIQVNGRISGLHCTWLVPCTRASSDGADGFLTLRVDPLEEGLSTFRAWPNWYLRGHPSCSAVGRSPSGESEGARN
ncbi:hypothetical protein M9H77_17974 [Catharanthus roseus]|uniref:Uncharacterized protein n=1 Tax=Catharanthus roseus TaxID=4058 RepID=A0ACC0B649_CATRO|nr:hypothetical protein M9H77_17974 [Catharanthus roseus]